MELYIQTFLMNGPQSKRFCVSFRWIPFVVWEYFQQEDLTDIGSVVFYLEGNLAEAMAHQTRNLNTLLYIPWLHTERFCLYA